jgi:hypothetical protein
MAMFGLFWLVLSLFQTNLLHTILTFQKKWEWGENEKNEVFQIWHFWLFFLNFGENDMGQFPSKI